MKILARGAVALFAAAMVFGVHGAVKVACIGDSITYGTGLGESRRELSYPAQLQKILDAAKPGAYEVANFGNPGRGIYLDSMRGSEKRGFRHMKEHRQALEWKPDIVVCNLGINDCGEYIKEFTNGRRRGQFVADYLALLGDYKKAGAGRFFIWTKLSPLAEGQKFHRSAEPFLMQTDLAKVAAQTGATGLDMLEPLREDMDAIFARDRIHPDAEGARRIAETTAKAILESGAPRAAVRLPDDLAPGACEVWLCAGQSNMQKGWGEFNSSPVEKARVAAELSRLDKLDIRFWDFNTGVWTRLDRTNALRKSAFGVSFAIRRAEASRKPVCICYVAAGGAPTESFLSESTMCKVDSRGAFVYPHLAAIATNRRRLDANADFPCLWVAREYPRRRNNMEEGHLWPVALMFDAGLSRLSSIPFDGVLWYQGESNATTCVAPDTPTPRDYQIETLRAIVEQLRELAPAPRPLVVVGLPKMNRPWEQYRQAQRMVAGEAGAIFVDTYAAGLGDPNDVHPRDKAAFADLAAKCVAERGL